MVDKNCKKCGDELELLKHIRGNGDEIIFIRCENDGLYAVYDTYSEEVIRTEDHDGNHEIPSVASLKLNNRDRVEVQFCDKCGFYAVDEGLPV